MPPTIQKEMTFKLSDIPPADVRNLSSTVLTAVREFYKDPENRKAYEMWKEQKKHQN